MVGGTGSGELPERRGFVLVEDVKAFVNDVLQSRPVVIPSAGHPLNVEEPQDFHAAVMEFRRE
jgi:pimeloyl-ACP methyl ester carboxylesterase